MIVAVVLLALGGVAIALLHRVDADRLRPILDFAGRSRRSTVTRRIQAALAIAGVERRLLVLVVIAAYALAYVSTRPLREAQERERGLRARRLMSCWMLLARIATVAQAARRGDESQREHALGAITQMAIQASALIGDLLDARARRAHVCSSNLYVAVDEACLGPLRHRDGQ